MLSQTLSQRSVRRKGAERKGRAAKRAPKEPSATKLKEALQKPRYDTTRVHFLVPRHSRQMGPKRPWRGLGRADRQRAIAELVVAVSKNHARLRRAPTGELVRIKCGRTVEPRSARRLFAPKKDIVRAMRESSAARKSRRTKAYLLWCEQNDVEPGWLAGVDGATWWWV